MSTSPDVLIVGAGLAGLCCARKLQEKGVSFAILEASDGVGGRVRSDRVDGYVLDRGFQVLLTAYPEAQRELDYARLDLKKFTPGAFSWYGGRMNKLIDPWRTSDAWWEALRSDFATLGDKLRMARLRRRVTGQSIGEIFKDSDRATKDALESDGFSKELIHHFFRPFLGGILLDGELKSSSRMFEFVFKMLAEGDTAVPVERPSSASSKLSVLRRLVGRGACAVRGGEVTNWKEKHTPAIELTPGKNQRPFIGIKPSSCAEPDTRRLPPTGC